MLLLETGMLGVFVGLDLFLFFVFWEAMLIPMYFIIGVWGGGNRVYAAIKFVLYTMVGSAADAGRHPGPLLPARRRHRRSTPSTCPTLARYVLAARARRRTSCSSPSRWPSPSRCRCSRSTRGCPTRTSRRRRRARVILAGVLLKMGTYGFLRFCLPLFPDASLAFAPLVFALAVIGIIYGAWVSTVQPDLKKLVAYSSVSHLGFVMLGLFTLNPQGLVGGVIQMINHGLTTGALFLMVGMIYERRHTRLIADFGGLWKVIPAFSALFLVVCLSSLGPARPQRLRRRVPHPGRRLPGEPAGWRRWPPPASSSPPSTCCGCTSAWSSARSRHEANRRLPDLTPARVGGARARARCSSCGSASTRRPSPGKTEATVAGPASPRSQSKAAAAAALAVAAADDHPTVAAPCPVVDLDGRSRRCWCSAPTALVLAARPAAAARPQGRTSAASRLAACSALAALVALAAIGWGRGARASATWWCSTATRSSSTS